MADSFMSRIGSAARTLIRGESASTSVIPISKTSAQTIGDIDQTTWMGPLQPIGTFLPSLDPRQWDYKVGRNLFYLPRGDQRISFPLLREIAYCCDLMRFAIETRKDQMCALTHNFKLTLDSGKSEDDDPRIDMLEEFFAKPDKINSWRDWLRVAIEEVFTTDALSIYRQKTRGNKLWALELIDGATLFPLVDGNGRTPSAPDPAYQQILKGVPKSNYTTAELIYAPYSKRIYTPYGYPVVEQAMNAAQTEIERMKSQLAYFTDGSYPDKYLVAPDGMKPEQVLAWEKRVNAIMSGNLGARRQVPFMVHGTEIKELKSPALKDDFDEWLARKICFAFSIPPTPFIKANNRATAGSEKDRALEEGLAPLQLFFKGVINDIIQNDFGFNDIEFSWNDTQDVDPAVQATVDASDIKSAIRSLNAVRAAVS